MRVHDFSFGIFFTYYHRYFLGKTSQRTPKHACDLKRPLKFQNLLISLVKFDAMYHLLSIFGVKQTLNMMK